MTPTLSKSVRVLERSVASFGRVWFASPDEDGAVREEVEHQTISISDVDWEDFGSPDTLTVTIQPGDLLN